MKNTLVLLFAKIFEKGIMFLFFILLAQNFGKGVVGEFSYYYSIVVILFVFFDLGGEFYQIREFSKNESIKKFNIIFLLKTFIFSIVFMLTMVLYNNIYILIFLFTYYLSSIISIFKSSLYVHNQYIAEAKYTIIEKSFFLVMILLNSISVQNLLVVYMAFVISKLIYILIVFKKSYKLDYLLNAKNIFDSKFAKEYLLNSWSYILHSLLVVVFVQIDIIMLKYMDISFEDIGLYSIALKVYAISIVIADVLFKQYYPKVAKYVQNGNSTELKGLVLKVQNMNLYFSFYLALFVILFSKEIISVAFGNAFSESSTMLMMLSIIIVFRFSMYTYTAILSSSNLNYIKLYTSIACVLINIVLNYILIPIYGVYGAIIATIVTEIVLVVLYKISSYKIIFTNYITLQEFLTISFTILIVVYMINNDIPIYLKLGISLLLLISLIMNKNNIKEKLNFRENSNV